VPNPRTSPASRRRSRSAHEAVLAAAARIAGRRGYSGTAIEEIASEAEVGKQTIYRWWLNKAALFIEVYGHLVPPDLVAEDTGTLTGDLEALLARLGHLYADTPAGTILSGLIAEAQTDPVLSAQLRDAYVAPRRSILRGIFARAVARGEILAPADPDFVSDLFSAAVWFRLLLGECRLDAGFSRHLVDALRHVLAPPLPSGSPSSNSSASSSAARA
jgi:AcrR family transcriptional regulator